MAQKVLMQNKTPIVYQPVRRFMQYGPGAYQTGMERMVADKFAHFNL